MRRTQLAAVFVASLYMAAPAQSETVYQFVLECKTETLARCFTIIGHRLDSLRAAEQGRGFCLPSVWGATMVVSNSYPVSILEHVRLALSAARFGNAERPVEEQMKAIVAEIYPCERETIGASAAK